jgi:hypothetical protein
MNLSFCCCFCWFFLYFTERFENTSDLFGVSMWTDNKEDSFNINFHVYHSLMYTRKRNENKIFHLRRRRKNVKNIRKWKFEVANYLCDSILIWKKLIKEAGKENFIFILRSVLSAVTQQFQIHTSPHRERKKYIKNFAHQKWKNCALNCKNRPNFSSFSFTLNSKKKNENVFITKNIYHFSHMLCIYVHNSFQ